MEVLILIVSILTQFKVSSSVISLRGLITHQDQAKRNWNHVSTTLFPNILFEKIYLFQNKQIH